MSRLRFSLPLVLLVSAHLFSDDVPRGTKLTVRVTTTVTSERSLAGDPVDGVLVNDLAVKGKLIAPQGSAVHGSVTSADPTDPAHTGRRSLPGSIAIRFDTIETPEGTYRLSTDQYTRQGRTRGGSPVGGMGGGISIDPVGGVRPQSPLPTIDSGGVTMGSTGPGASIPAGTVVTFKLVAFSEVDSKK